MKAPSSDKATTAQRALQSAIENIVKYGRRPQNRTERRAERNVDYGDYLKALVGEIREVTDEPMKA